MAAEVDGDDDDVIAAINIIPFVDIVLVLLIIFMLTSTVIVRAALQVELPKAASAETSVSATVNLILKSDGSLLVDGREMSMQQAATHIRGVDDPKAQAVISADKSIEYGSVIAVIDLVKSNGIKTFALNVERESRTP